mmetsp:Transcript_23723/g.26178  ORF Transcript_23723/g.26178 Transcript_23723/m.26178 type:complete len:210 (+) Transcript_23723:138-767(+)
MNGVTFLVQLGDHSLTNPSTFCFPLFCLRKTTRIGIAALTERHQEALRPNNLRRQIHSEHKFRRALGLWSSNVKLDTVGLEDIHSKFFPAFVLRRRVGFRINVMAPPSRHALGHCALQGSIAEMGEFYKRCRRALHPRDVIYRPVSCRLAVHQSGIGILESGGAISTAIFDSYGIRINIDVRFNLRFLQLSFRFWKQLCGSRKTLATNN